MIVALIGTTRLDLLVLAGPLALASLHRRRRTLPWFTLGLWPLAAWEVFSVDVLRVPFPNTAYAKLATGSASRNCCTRASSTCSTPSTGIRSRSW